MTKASAASAASAATRVVSFGEVMLRLKAADGERLMQSPSLQASFGGAEANVAVSLAAFGVEAAFATALPDTPIADACVAELRSFGVDVSNVVRRPGRMGLYFLEPGAGPRPPRVDYDRQHSAMAQVQPGEFDWDKVLAGASMLHLTGITSAIGEGARALNQEAAETARRLGISVVFDLNFRASLWRDDQDVAGTMTALMRRADVAIVNETHARQCLGVALDGAAAATLTGAARQEALCAEVARAFPKLDVVAITTRDDAGAGRSRSSACMRKSGQFYESRVHDITDTVDRVGAGDAFAAGLIHGLVRGLDGQATLEFAAAASRLKNTILGDFNRVSVAEVEALARGEESGRIQR